MLTPDRVRPGDDAGVSLVETMVVMAVTTVVGAMALSFFVWTGRSTADAAANSLTTDGVRLGVSSMAATLRLADSPTSTPGATTFRVLTPLSRTTLAFFANDNANRAGTGARALPTRVVYSATGTPATGTKVTESRYRPLPGAVASPTAWQAAYPTSPTSTRTLVRGAQSVRFDYTTVNPDTGALQTVSDTALSTVADAQVAAVTVTVVTVSSTGRPAQTVTATAVFTGSTS